MRKLISLVAVLFAATVILAATLEPLNVKTGLWQVTMVSKINGMPAPNTNTTRPSHCLISELLRVGTRPPRHDAALHSWLMQPKPVQPKNAEGKIPEADGRLEWRFEPMTSSLSAMLRPIARAAADLLTSSDLALVRTCASPTCRWFFLDTSKNHHRRWCSMKQCGNRAKVRRFYAKKKTA